MRLFVGCEIGAAVGIAGAALIRTLQARVVQSAPQARLTWVPPERFHVTVRFIGHVDATRAAAIDEALRPRLDSQAFDMAIDGVGVFPDRRPPRVVWAGLSTGRREMVALAHEVTARLATVMPLDNEELRPHLTLARVKDPRGLRAQVLFDGLEAVSLGLTRVDAVTLFESRQTGGVLRYVPLLRTALEG
jgi:2'-5' RNA ligase